MAKGGQSVEELDDKSPLAMFIEALRVGNLYVILKMDTLASYAMAILYADTEEAVRQKRKQESMTGAKRPEHPRWVGRIGGTSSGR